MSKISVIINTINEERDLPRAIKSIAWADEIIVVDMHSDDNTVSLAKDFGAKVFSHERTNYVEPARNFAISKATGDWILILDADEVVPKALAKKLKQIVQNPAAESYRIARKNIIFGKWIKNSRWWPDYNIRFFKKGTVVWDSQIHSVPITSGIVAEIEAKKELALVHYNYESIEDYIERLNRYSSIQAKRLIEKNYQFKWQDLINRPSSEFLGRYFAGEGYKDGLHGLALALLQSFSELVLYLKVWQAYKFAPEKLKVKEVIWAAKNRDKDARYWEADTLLKEHGGLAYRIKRKLKI